MSPSKFVVCLMASLSALIQAAPLKTPSLLPRLDNSTSVIYSNATGRPSLPPSNTPILSPTTLFPLHTSLYHSKTGAIDFDALGGTVLRDHTSNGADISTLATFFIPDTLTGRTCEIVLDISYQHVSGSHRADIYTSNAPASTNTTSWPQGNMRNNPIGRVLVSDLGGRATWEQTIGSGPVFACGDYAGQYVAGEVVPVGDDDFIAWRVGAEFSEGVKIVVS